MDPMARRSPRWNLLPVLRICNEGGRRSNNTTWISRFGKTDPPCPSQQASVYQSLSLEPDLSWSPQHRRPKCPFSFHTHFGWKKIPHRKKKKKRLINARKSRQCSTKNVLARTIKGQEQKFRRLLHILCIPNGKIASWHSQSMLRREMRKAKGCEKQMKRTYEKWQWGRHPSVETWVHDFLEYVDDSGDQRKWHPRMNVINPFCISEVIGCFAVQVWMTRVLGATKKRNEGIWRDLVWEQTQ